MKRMNRLLNRMDMEGGHRLENVYQDLVQLRKEFEVSVKQAEQVFTKFLAELEIKMQKLELKLVKLEVKVYSGSSSHHGGQYR